LSEGRTRFREIGSPGETAHHRNEAAAGRTKIMSEKETSHLRNKRSSRRGRRGKGAWVSISADW